MHTNWLYDESPRDTTIRTICRYAMQASECFEREADRCPGASARELAIFVKLRSPHLGTDLASLAFAAIDAVAAIWDDPAWIPRRGELRTLFDEASDIKATEPHLMVLRRACEARYR